MDHVHAVFGDLIGKRRQDAKSRVTVRRPSAMDGASLAMRMAGVLAAVALAFGGISLWAIPSLRDPGLWIPNLVSGLLVMALGLVLVNGLLERRARLERDRQLSSLMNFVILWVQPHVISLLTVIVDPAMRLGPIGDRPEGWADLAKPIRSKMEIYQGVLDAECMESLERIRNCLQLLSEDRFEVDGNVGALRTYMLVAPLVRHLERLRQRFFPKGEEYIYGGMVPLIEKWRVQRPTLPPLEAFEGR